MKRSPLWGPSAAVAEYTLYVGAVADPAQIWVVDATTLKLKTRIKNTGKWMTGLHYSAQTGRVYAANGSGEILVINPQPTH